MSRIVGPAEDVFRRLKDEIVKRCHPPFAVHSLFPPSNFVITRSSPFETLQAIYENGVYLFKYSRTATEPIRVTFDPKPEEQWIGELKLDGLAADSIPEAASRIWNRLLRPGAPPIRESPEGRKIG